MIKLSRKAEDLLQEILDHRDEKGNCSSDYWKDKFESLSASDDALLRSLFKELREADMISTSWADNYPYILFVLGNGISYFDEKKRAEQAADRSTYTNNFYGNLSGVQIQQGTYNSEQIQCLQTPVDTTKIDELIQMIKKYDILLDDEYGTEKASEIRRAAKELDNAVNKSTNSKPEKVRHLLNYIRDLSVNATGGLIAAGIVQLITNILG